MTTESYTHVELDQLAGTMLHQGGIGAVLGTFIEWTDRPDNLALAEWVNHLPVGVAIDILSTNALLYAEVKSRLEGITSANAAALDSCVARVKAEAGSVNDEFSNIMQVEFGKDRKANGG